MSDLYTVKLKATFAGTNVFVTFSSKSKRLRLFLLYHSVHSFFAVPAAVKLPMPEASLRHAMWLVFSGSLHVSTQKHHMIFPMRACVWRVQKALDVFTRSHHKNVSKLIVCYIHLCMAFHSSMTWKVVDNLVCTFGSRKASGDLYCWMFIIDVIWPPVHTMTTEEVVDNQETHTNSIFWQFLYAGENLTWILLVHFMRNDFVYLFGV